MFFILSSIYVFFSFVAYAFVVISKNPLPNPRYYRFTPMFSSKNFRVSALKFRYLTHFQLIFVYCVR